MSLRTYLADVFTRHQIHLQRLAGGERNRLLPLLEQMKQAIQAELLSLPSESNQQRLQNVLIIIEGIVADTFEEMAEQALAEVAAIGAYEAEFSAKAVGMVATHEMAVPTAEMVAAIVTDKPATVVSGKKVQRLTLRGMWDELITKKPGEVSRVIQQSYLAGDPLQQISQRLDQVVDGRTESQIEAVVRTSVNHMATQARQMTMDQNAEILDGVQWVATLDSRTTVICGSRDGQVYPVDSGPRPPAHWNCRSTVAPVIKPEFAIPGFDKLRSSIDGPVSAKTTYNSWLKRQSAEFQDDVLGAERAKLFRSGGLSLKKFVDERGVLYSLDDLRRAEPLAFERAGL